MAKNKWTRDELIVAFNLYCVTPFGKIHNRNPDVIQLASLIGRTPSAVSWKLANFARFDPTLAARGVKGASHGSIAEKEVWDAFNMDWDKLSHESEKLLAISFLVCFFIEKVIQKTSGEINKSRRNFTARFGIGQLRFSLFWCTETPRVPGRTIVLQLAR